MISAVDYREYEKANIIFSNGDWQIEYIEKEGEGQMLFIEATISYENVPFNISVKMRPSIDFGNGFSYSGIITPTDPIEMFTMNERYKVDINMFTVDEEVFDSISGFVKKGCTFKLKSGNKEVGRGRVIDFLYIYY